MSRILFNNDEYHRRYIVMMDRRIDSEQPFRTGCTLGSLFPDRENGVAPKITMEHRVDLPAHFRENSGLLMNYGF